jgi:hypothetical protein
VAEPSERRRDRKLRRLKHNKTNAGRRKFKLRQKQHRSALKRRHRNRPDPCPYCGRPPRLYRSSEPIYGKDNGPAWVCAGWPDCNALVLCHPGGTQPLGTLANEDLRRARRRTHVLLDKLFDPGPMNRSQVYSELAAFMNLDVQDTHIGMFDLGQCEHAAAFARAKLRAIYGKATT